MLEVGGAEDDYESLFDVMVSDRLKDCLPTGALTYVLSREGDECYSSEEIAELADIHVNNFQDGKYKGNAVTNLDMGNQNSNLSLLAHGMVKTPDTLAKQKNPSLSPQK